MLPVGPHRASSVGFIRPIVSSAALSSGATMTTTDDTDDEELRLLLARSFVANGWDEPGMEAYDSYPESRYADAENRNQ